MTAWSDAIAALPAPYLWWKVDETSGTSAADSSGNGQTGTYSSATLNQAGLIPGDPGGKSVSFPTTAGNVSKSAGMSYPNIGVTYATTFRTTTDVASGRFFQANSSNTNLSAAVTSMIARVSIGQAASFAYDPSVLADGVAHLIVYVVRASTAELWVDGVMVASGAHAGVAGTMTSFFVKQSSGSPVGDFDDTLIWSTDLSAAQIGTLHSGWVGSAPAAGSVTLAASRAAKTASFAVATVLAASLAATLPGKTAAFDATVVPTPVAQLAATLRPKTATINVDVPALPDRVVSLSGTLARKTAAITAVFVSDAALSAEVPAKTATFALENPEAGPAATLAAALPRKLGAFSVDVAPGAILAGQLQPKIATYVVRAVTPVTPAPQVVTQAQAVVSAQAFGPVTMQGTQPVYAASEAMIARGRQQIVVSGVDVTYFRDVVTPDVDYTLLEPLLYGPGSIEFPQISACFETEGVGDLWWLRAQAPVEVNLVVDDVVTALLYKGFVADFDKAGRTLTVGLGGEANGRAAMRDRQVPIFPRINDVGHQLADAVRDLGLPHYPPLGAVTGIELMTTGGTGHLDHINNLVAKSWTRSGKQWTVMPNPASGVYETHRKDATTVHATAFLDDARTVGKLRRDIAEEPNQIFVTCVTPAGMRVRFGKYPGLVQGPVPDFPGSMFLGDSGEGVRLLVGKLHASGYLRLVDVAGGYDDDVMRAVMQLQDDAGLPETGEVNLGTWRALYDLDVTGLSLEWANIQPAAQRSKVRKFDRSANGTIMGFNDEYDPDAIVRHRSIDLGAGVTRKQAREYAKTVLHDSDDANWVGDITFNTGALIRGQAGIGDTLTSADVMDARELRPGMNIMLPAFDGGTLVHVSACQVSRDGIVTATVDTRFRDAMEVWDVIARNKASRNDPSRQRERTFRASTIAKDSIGEWDEFGGMLGVDLPLQRGWNKFPVVAAMEGQIHKLKVALANPAEFAVAVWGEEPDVGWLNDTIQYPLTVSGTKAWETRGDALDDRLLLYSAGTHDEPCGYSPGRKKWKSVTGEETNPDYAPNADTNDTGTDDQETITVTTSESAGTLTGKFVDEAGFRYFAADRKVVWVTVWVRGDNTLPLGRVMWPQLEAGV